MGGIFAKVISTANNYLFSPASNLIHDVYQRFIRPDANETPNPARLAHPGGGAGCVRAAAGGVLRVDLKAALYAYTVYGAAVTPSVMAVFFWKRANTPGAISSIVAGTVVTVVWNVAGIEVARRGLSGAGCLAAGPDRVSLATAPPPQEKWEPFQ